MPRLSNDGSDVDASSEYDSDSGSSGHTIYNYRPDTSGQDDAPNQAPDYSTNFFAPPLSPTAPASGHAVHGEKRKADDSGDGGHSHTNGVKHPRLTSSRSNSSASESNASSEAENGYYDDDDIYPPPDAAVAAPVPRPAAPAPWPPAPALRQAAPVHGSFLTWVNSTIPQSTSHLMSNGLPKTAGQVWAESFPDIQLEGKAGTDVLSVLPAKRVPAVVKKFKVDTKPQNMAAWLIQATGAVLPRGRACTRCAEGHGVFGPTCVVMPDGEMGSRTLNTCANCWYNRMGFCCSVRVGDRKRQSTNPRPDLVVRHWSGKKKAPAVVAPPPAQASMVHPAYASSSKAASSWEPFPGAAAAATPAREPTPVNEPAPAYEPTLNQATDDHNPEFPTTAFDLLTSIGHPPPIPVAPVAPKSLPLPPRPPPPQVKPSSSPPTTVLLTNSLDGKVESWEKRYGNMGTQELVEMQRVLVERLEDTTMRMVAMQKVLAGRLAGSR